jgi:zinc D-Ala-D-Ala dipeptidase
MASSPGRSFAQEKPSLVDIRDIDPTITIELRYAGPHNIAGRALYKRGTRPLAHPEVAQRLSIAQKYLRRYGYGLKIWDAYRPKEIQVELWQASRNNDYVANPDAGAGSLHTWGLAVDATLADDYHRAVPMPTDFDDFTPAAMWKYTGNDPFIREHLFMLQTAMREAGFYGLRSEWWHFAIDKWQKLMPPEEAKRAAEAMGQTLEGDL